MELRLLAHYVLLFKKFAPTLIFSFTIKCNIYSSIAGRLLSKAVVCNVTGLGTASLGSSWRHRLALKFYAWALTYPMRVCAQNTIDFRWLRDDCRIPEARLKLLPGSGVDVAKFYPRQDLLVKHNDRGFKFLYVGRILGDKGLRELIASARWLHYDEGIDFELMLCGAIDEMNTSFISKHEVELWCEESFIGWIPHTDDILSEYRDSDCVVLPSYREGMPRVLLEAGSVGLPAVATEVPGCCEIIEHGFNGLLCKPRSSTSLGLAMKEMIGQTSDCRKRMSRNARQRIEERFSDEVVIEHALAIVKVVETGVSNEIS